MLSESLEVQQEAKFEIAILYNGVPKHFRVENSELVKQVLNRAVEAFGTIPQPHTLALFTASGTELKDADTVKQAGIRPHEKLLLRPSAVKGGVAS